VYAGQEWDVGSRQTLPDGARKWFQLPRCLNVCVLVALVAGASFQLALSVSRPVAVGFLATPRLSAVALAIAAAFAYFRISRMIDDLK